LAPPPPSPVSKLEKEDGERETPCWREREGGCGGGASSYDSEKAKKA
jgi:hypothetical protein